MEIMEHSYITAAIINFAGRLAEFGMKKEGELPEEDNALIESMFLGCAMLVSPEASAQALREIGRFFLILAVSGDFRAMLDRLEQEERRGLTEILESACSGIRR